ncbi:MAG TPA: hypothetical protein VGB79_12745 [Allosphingosinicella sp.]
MYEPVPHARAFHHAPPHPYDWAEPPRRRRRRLSRIGMTVLLVIFAIFCALGLLALKIGLAVYQSPATPQIANSAARIGTVVADVAMKDAEVPDELREAVTAEADTLRRELIKGEAEGARGGASPGAAH